MQEIYKDIVGYEGLYQVSNLGNVKSFKYGKQRILKPGVNKCGYLNLNLWINSFSKNFKIHRLVAKAFIENIDNKEYVNHINGIKTDNRVENLEWCTASENQLHSYKLGLKIAKKGENANNAKLTNKQVLAIRNDNRMQKEIAKDYNVHQTLISCIKRYKFWNHI